MGFCIPMEGYYEGQYDCMFVEAGAINAIDKVIRQNSANDEAVEDLHHQNWEAVGGPATEICEDPDVVKCTLTFQFKRKFAEDRNDLQEDYEITPGVYQPVDIIGFIKPTTEVLVLSDLKPVATWLNTPAVPILPKSANPHTERYVFTAIGTATLLYFLYKKYQKAVKGEAV